jgi:ABC-type glycerol-3-phosphate transport system substrate-binding protein
LSFYRGKVWALPTTPASVALHWNKDHFRAAGLDPERPPRTIEELDAFAEKLTQRDADGKIVRMGFMPSESGWWNWGWGYFFGGKLYDGKGRITANAPENIRAFRWIQSYAKKYDVKDLQVFQSGFGNFSSPQNAFLAGKVSMEIQGVWMYNFINKYAPHIQWKCAPFPPPADRPDLANSTPVDIDTLVIPTGARHPREAWEFIKFVQSRKGMELLCMGQRKHSPLAESSPEFLKEHPHPYLQVFIDLAKSKNTFSPPQIGIWREYQDEMTNAFSNVWLGKMTPEEALNNVQARMQKKFERELRQKRRRS